MRYTNPRIVVAMLALATAPSKDYDDGRGRAEVSLPLYGTGAVKLSKRKEVTSNVRLIRLN